MVYQSSSRCFKTPNPSPHARPAPSLQLAKPSRVHRTRRHDPSALGVAMRFWVCPRVCPRACATARGASSFRLAPFESLSDQPESENRKARHEALSARSIASLASAQAASAQASPAAASSSWPTRSSPVATLAQAARAAEPESLATTAVRHGTVQGGARRRALNSTQLCQLNF